MAGRVAENFTGFSEMLQQTTHSVCLALTAYKLPHLIGF